MQDIRNNSGRYIEASCGYFEVNGITRNKKNNSKKISYEKISCND